MIHITYIGYQMNRFERPIPSQVYKWLSIIYLEFLIKNSMKSWYLHCSYFCQLRSGVEVLNW